MKLRPPSASLSFKLFLAATLVQALMVALITVIGIEVMTDEFIARTEQRVEEDRHLLDAAVAPIVAAGGGGALQGLLEHLRSDRGLTYLVMCDPDGKPLAAAGRDPAEPLPPISKSLRDPVVRAGGQFHADTRITSAGRPLGTLRFGVSTRFLEEARSALVQKALIIGGVALLVSLVLIGMVSYWLTRNLQRLTEASERVAAGELDVQLPVESEDEVGRLVHAFNLMAEAVRSRIRALTESEAKFHAIADYSYDAELWFNPQGRIIWVNPRIHDLTGYTVEECLANPAFPRPLFASEDAAMTMKQIRRALKGGTGQDFEFRVRRKDGTVLWAAADWRPIFDTDGRNMGIRISVRDVTKRREAEQRLAATVAELRNAQSVQHAYLERAQDEHARLSALLAAMDFGILFVGNDGKIVYSNPAFNRIWMIPPGTNLVGMPPTRALERSGGALVRPDEQLRYVLTLPGDGGTPGTYEVQFADGRLVNQQCHRVEDVFGRPVGHIWIYEDVTLERQTAEQLTYLAERDPLTGLYNRHRFNEELGRLIAEAERTGSRVALLFFDLDEFKYINDNFGHRAGDAMLIRVAGEVAQQVRKSEILARLGGDEFAILVPGASDEQLAAVAERLTRAIAAMQFSFEGQNLRLTSSLGIAIYPDHAANAEELIAHADAAMYQAKEAGKNVWRVYRPDLDTSRQMLSTITWNDRIAHALEHNLMELHYQGVFEAASGRVTHLEVLLRMRDKDDPSRIYMPGQFVPVAERSGRILDIDRWVIRRTVEMLAATPDLPALAVNISGRSFDEPALPRYIAEELKRCGVAPQRLLVELTETSAVSDLYDARRFIDALHQTGCHVCLDDFGTGFSSFAYLKHLQVDAVKIDGLFIRELAQQHDNQVFVQAIVSVARGLRKTTIAECVEDQQALDMLRGFGVDSVQGYFLGYPDPDYRVALRRK